jgi:phosphoribosylaminoimidazole-succinocarboxamide synthase
MNLGGRVIVLIDEIFTPDSSAFLFRRLSRTQTRRRKKQLSKEFVRF